MKQNTETLQNFQVNRDGQPDLDYIALQERRQRHARVANLGHGTLHVLGTAGAYLARKTGTVMLESYAVLYDAINETDTLTELRTPDQSF